ncbi:MAG: sel1 repeat family protein [Erysipelotrichaceae bacterium]|nr:sel1 repeat family protein [Erysipelotrichaceae bacterium]
MSKDYRYYNVAQALAYYEQSAKQKDNYGMVQLGLLYNLGLGVTQSYEKANEWYLKAVQEINDNNNNLDDEMLGILYNNLGSNCLTGKGIEQNYDDALFLLNEAIKYDKESASRNLGDMYYYGQGVEIDYAKAFELYEIAANAGNTQAMDDLGFYYKKGKNVPQDYQKAFEWFSQSAKQNSTYGMFQLSMMYESGQYVEKDYQQSNIYYQKSY